MNILSQIKQFRWTLMRRYYSTKSGFTRAGQLTPFVTRQEGNDILRDALLSGKPLMVARHGSNELNFVYRPSTRKLHELCVCAGFFPESETLGERFRKEYCLWSSEIDLLGVWNYRHARFVPEQRLFRLMKPGTRLIDLQSLTPFLHENPWTRTLEGRRVLVVHPFRDTILRQYERRGELFKDPQVLPEFAHLDVIPAVQSIGGRAEGFESWFDALEFMKNEISRVEFDVALISCGAYGLPLAHHVKKMGKVGIHVGGALQLLFGIKGRRWEGEGKCYNYDQKYYNKNWIRPNDSERPPMADRVEGACYW